MESVIDKFKSLNVKTGNQYLKTSIYRSKNKAHFDCYLKDEEVNYSNQDQEYVDGEDLSETLVVERSKNPTNSLILKGLPKRLTEKDLWKILRHFRLTPKHVILAKSLYSGESLGIVCIEFHTKQDSIYWMEENKKVVSFPKYKLLMEYVLLGNLDVSDKSIWICSVCGFGNLSLDHCVICDAIKDDTVPKDDEACYYPTLTIMLNGLSESTTYLSVMITLQSFLPGQFYKLKNIRVVRSRICRRRRVCYLRISSMLDALLIYDDLFKFGSSLLIDGNPVTLSYCKYELGYRKYMYKYQVECQADLVKKDLDNYFKNIMDDPENKDVVLNVINNSDNPKPDISKYFYDYNLHMFYDLDTGLHYNHTLNIFYDHKIGKYVNWNCKKTAHCPVLDDVKTSNDKKQTQVSDLKSAQRKHAPCDPSPKEKEKKITHKKNKGGAKKFDGVKPSDVQGGKHKRHHRENPLHISSEGKKNHDSNGENVFCKDIERWRKIFKFSYDEGPIDDLFANRVCMNMMKINRKRV